MEPRSKSAGRGDDLQDTAEGSKPLSVHPSALVSHRPGFSPVALLGRRPLLVFAVLAVYFVAQAGIRMALPPSLELDEAQQVFLSQWFALGYDTQPPFYNWLQYGVISFFGVSVAALTLLKNAMLFASYAFYGLAAMSVLKDRRLAVAALLALLTIPQISFEAQRDLTHTIAIIFAACLFLFALFRTLDRPSVGGYVLTGVAIGIGIISKYNFVLLPAAAFMALLWEPAFRRRVFDWRLLLTVVAAVLIVLPHGLWFIDHMATATSGTIDKMTDDVPGAGRWAETALGVVSLVLAIPAFCGVTVGVFALALGTDFFAALKSGNVWTRLIERTVLFGVLLLLSIVVFSGAVEVRARWLTPLLVVVPLYLCLKFEAAGLSPDRVLRRMVPVALFVMVLIPAILAGRILTPAWTGHYDKLTVPYEPMVEHLIDAAAEAPGLVIAGDVQLGGNIRLHAPGVHVLTPNYPGYVPTAAADAPILAIWRERRSGRQVADMPDELSAFVATKLRPGDRIGPVQFVRLPYHFGDGNDAYTFSYAWIGKPEQDRQ